MKFVDKISVAALLHDIGKFYQRTDLELKNKNNYAYCPNEERSHIHSAYTAQFFDDFEDEFRIFKNDVHDDENILNMAAYHHKPSSAYENIISEADKLSSGFDRANYEEYNNNVSNEEIKGQKKYNQDRLLSPFSRLYVGANEKELKIDDKFYEIDELVPENIFPNSLKNLNSKNGGSSRNRYYKLWDKFVNDLRLVKFDHAADSFDNFYQNLLYVLERYTTFIPSSDYKTVADISLFDHSKTVAAIANALYLFQKNSNNFSSKNITDREEEKYLMVQGDFSGIQRFIFDRNGESNKFAAKILRAKSLFVSAFTELTASYICSKAGANNASIVANAGGKFIIILQNKEEVRNVVVNAKRDIVNNFLYDVTYLQTMFNIATLSLCGNDFKMGNFSLKMKSLAASLELEKIRPVVDKDRHVFSFFLDKVSNSGGVCDICGIRPIEKHKKIGEENIGLCAFDEMSIANGKDLVTNDFIILKTVTFRNVVENKSKEKFSIIDFASIINNEGILNQKPDNEDIVYDVRGTYDIKGRPFKFSGYAKKPYKAYVPIFEKGDVCNVKYKDIPEANRNEDARTGAIKLFNYISRDGRNVIEKNGEKRCVGLPHLAALKGDIDNAGQIFINGFKKNMSSSDGYEDIYTISRFSMVSRMMDYFFGVWLPYKFTDSSGFSSIYTVFAGGDDLFLIGPWNQIIRLSELISDKMEELSGGNKVLHISIGVALAKSNVPIYRLADKAEEELEKAKKIDEGKNAITVFGRTLKWTEFHDVFKLEKYFERLLDDGVSIGYIHRVMKFIEMSETMKSYIRKGEININHLYDNAKWRALFRYITSRNYSKNHELMNEMDLIPGYIEKYGYNLTIPISYAVYDRRD